MKKITIKNVKNIQSLEFIFPEKHGVFLIAGSNGIGKTTLLICLDRLCNSLGFARGLSTSQTFHGVDQYTKSSIMYTNTEMQPKDITFRKKHQRWTSSPRGHQNILPSFGFQESVFVRADSKRIDALQEEIKKGKFVSANKSLQNYLNSIFETNRFDKLKRLKITHGRGKNSTYFYVLEDEKGRNFSEKRFSTGELALLRLVEKTLNIQPKSLILLDEAELSLHPRVQKNLLDYLKKISEEKQLTIFVATHSISMLRSMPSQNIFLLELDNNTNTIRSIHPCFPARAIGTVDFIEDSVYDLVVFVEDEISKQLFMEMRDVIRKLESKWKTMRLCVVPVGGYYQTASMAVETTNKFGQSTVVRAALDADAFSKENLKRDSKFKVLYEKNKSKIYNLGWTPEVLFIQQLETNMVKFTNDIKEKFSSDLPHILNSMDYMNLGEGNPRQLAKDKFKCIVEYLEKHSGLKKDRIQDTLIRLIVNSINEKEIKKNIAPILAI